MKKISITLDPKSIAEAVASLLEYRQQIDIYAKNITERLAKIGVDTASVIFTNALYNNTEQADVDIDAQPTTNGWIITANGEAVVFIEFGAGIFHNGTEPYPAERPEGIVGIGEYGMGKGNQSAWGFYKNPDTKQGLVITHGTPAAMPMWYATAEMQRQLVSIAKEVFGNG